MQSNVNRESQLKGTELRLSLAKKGADAMPAGDTLVLGEKAYTGPELSQLVATYLQPYSLVHSTRGDYERAVEGRDSREDASKAFMATVEAAVTARYGANSSLFTTFGLKVKKKTAPLTSEQNVVRSAKARQTRLLRGTAGRKQKAALKGVVGNTLVVDTTNAQAKAVSLPAAGPVTPAAPASPTAPGSSMPGSAGNATK